MPLVLLLISLIFLALYYLFDLPKAETALRLAEGYYAKYGYWVVFIGALVEGTLFINWYIPGSTVVVLGILFARHNSTQVIIVIALAIVGFLLAAVFNYILGKYGWYRIFLKLGLKEPMERIKRRIEKYGLPIIFITYFHPNVGALTATSAGVLRLGFTRFCLYSLTGLVFWNTLWGTLIYVIGNVALKFVNRWTVTLIFALWFLAVILKFFKDREKAQINIP